LTGGAPILDLQDVAYRWPGRASFCLRVSHLALVPSETVLLLGESGSGKSTLLSLICGTVTADEGRVAIAGQDIASLSAGQRDRFRAEQIGLIFQQFNLLPFASVRDNIVLPLGFAPERHKRVADSHAEVDRLCDALGLPPNIDRDTTADYRGRADIVTGCRHANDVPQVAFCAVPRPWHDGFDGQPRCAIGRSI